MVRISDGEAGDRLFRSLVDSAPDAMVIVGPDGLIELVNAQTENLFGYARQELVGQPVEVLIPAGARGVHASHRAGFAARPALRPMGARTALRGQRKDGTSFPAEISLAPLDTAEGTLVCAAVRDVSERAELQLLAESERRLAALVGNSREMIYIQNADGSVGYANPAATAFFGGMESIRRPGGVLSRIHPDDLERATTELAGRVTSQGALPFVGFRALHADGSWRDVEGMSANLFDDPAVSGIVINAHDVTGRVRDARLLAAQREVLTRIATGEVLSVCLSGVAELVLDQAEGSVVQIAVSEGANGGLRYVVREGDLARAKGPEHCARAVTQAVESHQPAHLTFADVATGRMRASIALPLLGRASDDLLGVLTVCVPDAERGQQLEGVLDVARSVAQIALERQRDVDRLVDMALHDDLTGLPNRTLFVDRLRQALDAEARAGTVTAVLFCDVDEFKLVNDSKGHSVGDELLRDVAERIHAMLRPGDTVARFGGDEFVVLAVDLRSEEEALSVAERLVREVRVPLVVGGVEGVVTVSVGLAVASGRDDDGDALLARADAALYRAKALGRDRVEVFDADLQQLAHSRLETEAALRVAVETDQFAVHFQPQVDLQSGQVTCAEALLRWDRPGHGPLSPALFVPLAEEIGLIVRIGGWVLRTACEQGAAWARAGRPVVLAVNVSTRQLTYSGFAGLVQTVLEETGLPPYLLRLEVTETAIMEDVAALNETLDRITRLGVTISIDDFGTGYSSLLYLKRLPVSELKIDSAFVQGLGVSVEDESIVTGIVQLARALGLSTVAEGVETQEQLTFVRRLGCTTAQGYLLGRPMPAEVFWTWMTASDAGQVPHPRSGRSEAGDRRTELVGEHTELGGGRGPLT